MYKTIASYLANFLLFVVMVSAAVIYKSNSDSATAKWINIIVAAVFVCIALYYLFDYIKTRMHSTARGPSLAEAPTSQQAALAETVHLALPCSYLPNVTVFGGKSGILSFTPSKDDHLRLTTDQGEVIFNVPSSDVVEMKYRLGANDFKIITTANEYRILMTTEGAFWEGELGLSVSTGFGFGGPAYLGKSQTDICHWYALSKLLSPYFKMNDNSKALRLSLILLYSALGLTFWIPISIGLIIGVLRNGLHEFSGIGVAITPLLIMLVLWPFGMWLGYLFSIRYFGLNIREQKQPAQPS